MIHNKSSRIEKLLKDSLAGVKVEEKKSKRYENDYVRRKIQQPFPSNGARKLVGYFKVTNKSAGARIPL